MFSKSRSVSNFLLHHSLYCPADSLSQDSCIVSRHHIYIPGSKQRNGSVLVILFPFIEENKCFLETCSP